MEDKKKPETREKHKQKEEEQEAEENMLVLPHEVLFLVSMVLREVGEPTVLSLLFTCKALHDKLKATLPSPRMKGSVMDKHFFCELYVRKEEGGRGRREEGLVNGD
jgi:hypothetical protein